MRAFTKSDRQILTTSLYVEKFTDKTIVFTAEFRELILQGSSNFTQVEHFNTLLGIDCFDKKYVDSCLYRWRKQVVPGKRGRPKSTSKMTIEELEAVVAYQKEVIKQLKKAHGLSDDELYNTK